MSALRRVLACALVFPCLGAEATEEQSAPPVVASQARLFDPQAKDQDDLCFWVDRREPERSLVIAADKKAGKLFAYDLSGKTVQTIDCPEPGNIDARAGARVGERRLDLVAVVDRTEQSLRLYEVDPHSRQLRRVDAGIATGENYGGALYCSAKSGKTYFFVTSKTAGVSQFELFDAGQGQVGGRRVRHWPLGKCEGAVADDQAGAIYIAEERRGVWRAGAEPDNAAPGQLVVPHGGPDLSGDVEGLALVDAGEGQRWLVVSNQEADRFEVFRAEGNPTRIGSFAVADANHTDGLDAVAVPLGPQFPGGVFACHSAAPGGCPILLASWADVRRCFDGSPAAKRGLPDVLQD